MFVSMKFFIKIFCLFVWNEKYFLQWIKNVDELLLNVVEQNYDCF